MYGFQRREVTVSITVFVLLLQDLYQKDAEKMADICKIKCELEKKEKQLEVEQEKMTKEKNQVFLVEQKMNGTQCVIFFVCFLFNKLCMKMYYTTLCPYISLFLCLQLQSY